MQNFDLIVVGSGAALIVLEAALAQGKTCALVERHKFGGTCLNRGCIPSKILVHPADLIRECERGSQIGLEIAPPKVDWPKLGQRMWEKIGENRQILAAYQNWPGLTVFQGTARFTEPYVLEFLDQNGLKAAEIRSETIVIGVGGRAKRPAIDGLSETGFVNFESFFGDQF